MKKALLIVLIVGIFSVMALADALSETLTITFEAKKYSTLSLNWVTSSSTGWVFDPASYDTGDNNAVDAFLAASGYLVANLEIAANCDVNVGGAFTNDGILYGDNTKGLKVVAMTPDINNPGGYADAMHDEDWDYDTEISPLFNGKYNTTVRFNLARVVENSTWDWEELEHNEGAANNVTYTVTVTEL